MISVEGASKYFLSTTFSQKWAEFSSQQKSAAIEMARREFARALGRPLASDADGYKEGDRTCEEFAAYEQALYTLLRDAQPTGTGTAVPALDQQDQKAMPYTLAGHSGQWSPRALAWLGTLSVVARNGS